MPGVWHRYPCCRTWLAVPMHQHVSPQMMLVEQVSQGSAEVFQAVGFAQYGVVLALGSPAYFGTAGISRGK